MASAKKEWFNYCDSINTLKENHTVEDAFNSIINKLSNEYEVTDDFLIAAKRNKNSSNNISYGIVYEYFLSVNYCTNNSSKITTTTISDLAYNHDVFPKELKISDYKGNGNSTNIDFNNIDHPIKNKNVPYTKDELISVIKNQISKQFLLGWNKYNVNNWSANAYLVPVFSFDIKYHGETYTQEFNLYNGCLSISYPEAEKSTLAARKLKKTANAIAIISALIAVTLGIISLIKSSSFFYLGIIALVIAIFNIVITFAKGLDTYTNICIKHHGCNITKTSKLTIFLGILGIILGVVAVIL